MCGPTRRGFLKALGIGSISLLLPLLTPATGKAGGRKEICKGVSFLPPAYRALRSGIDGFIETLTSHPANEMEVQFFDSGTLMNADAQLPELKKGSIDFMFQSTTYISQDLPILGITGLPGICDQLHEHGDRLAMESPLWKLINDGLAKENLFMLTIGRGLVEPEYLWSMGLKITGLADLKGRTCRVVGHEAARLLEQVGAHVVRIPSSQTFLALQRGSVESAVLPVDTVIARNLQNQLRYCFKLPITAVGMAVFFLKDRWEKLPSGAKEAFWQAGHWYDNHQSRMGYKQIPQEQYWPMIEKAGIQIVLPSKEETDEFSKRCGSVWEWWTGAIGHEVGTRAIRLARGEI